MKQIILSLSFLLLFSFVFSSCKKDDESEDKKPGTIEFAFSVKAPVKKSIAISSQRVPAPSDIPAAVIVSIKDAQGTLVYNKEKVELFNMNGSYISKPLSLLQGGYTLEEYLVVDANGLVIYATPIAGSEKAYLVNKPLPIDFTVEKDKVLKLVPEVLSTVDSNPEDFGYTTFSFDIVKTFDFLIGVFVYNESKANFELTTAKLKVAANGNIIYTRDLDAVTNKVSLSENNTEYTLTVEKDGYNTYTQIFSAEELKLYFKSTDKGPLKVILTKGSVTPERAITMVTDQSTLKETVLWFDFIQGEPLILNWGDGSVDQIYPQQTRFSISHNYLSQDQYTIKIAGNSLNNLKGLSCGLCQITSINVSEATNLEGLDIRAGYLKELDISKNIHLKYVLCDNNMIETIDFSKNIELEGISCETNKLTTINVSSNINLRNLECSFNSINDIDVKNNPKLEALWSFQNNTTALDFSNNPELKELNCSGEMLSSINIYSNTKLESLICGGPKLTSIDVSNNTNLTRFYCTNSQLSSLNLTRNTKLKSITIGKNLTSLDLTNNQETRTLNLDNTNFNSEDISSLISTLVSFKRLSIPEDKCSINLQQMPSDQGLVYLKTLRDTYNWDVTINYVYFTIK